MTTIYSLLDLADFDDDDDLETILSKADKRKAHGKRWDTALTTIYI